MHFACVDALQRISIHFHTHFDASGDAWVTLERSDCTYHRVSCTHRSIKRLQLENTGDVGTKFVWDTSALGPHFSVSPSDGFLAPSQDVKLDITFHPTGVHADIRVERVRLKVSHRIIWYL